MRDRQRDARSFKRGTNDRKPLPVILIVTNGRRTEPQYLEKLKAKLPRGSGTVRVTPLPQTDPAKLVKEAKNQRKVDGLNYDVIWCVFDHDNHPSMKNPVTRSNSKDFRTVVSTPCFEIWFLLHFSYTTRRFRSYEELLPALREHLPEYDKAECPFEKLEPLTDTAISRAEKLRAHHSEHGTDSPATDMDQLVLALRELAGLHARA